MKYALFTILNILPLLTFAQYHFLIGSNGHIKMSGGQLVLTDTELNVEGDFQAAQGETILRATTNTSEGNIGGSGSTQFANLEINKTTSEVQLIGDIEISHTLTMNTGKLNLNNYDIQLGDGLDGTIIGESEASFIYSSAGGEIIKTSTLNAPNNQNPGNLGLSLTSADNLGVTTIRRGHYVETSGIEQFVQRYFEVSTTEANTTTNFEFYYLDTELNNLAKNQLMLWQDSNINGSWARTPIVASTPNSVSFNNIPSTGILNLGSNELFLSTKIVLPAIYNSDTQLMDANLTAMLPTTEPYSSMGYMNLQNEGISTALSTIIPEEEIVDWILLELRDANTPSTLIAVRAALLQRDGDVVDVDGKSPVRFADIAAGNYYIATRHRNHLGVMTANPVFIGY